MLELNGKNVLVFGGSSPIGQYLTPLLNNEGAKVFAPTHEQVDLLNEESVEEYFVSNEDFDYCCNLAGFNGGIQFNKERPYSIFTKNLRMGLNVVDYCMMYHVKKVVNVLASCSYPDGKNLLHEWDLWGGPCHDTVSCHGYAKRALEAMGRFAHKQHDMNVVSCVLTNCYGPRDKTDLNKTKFVMAAIKRIVDAKNSNAETVEFWGTGEACREIMHFRDAAQGILLTLKRYENCSIPINIGIGRDYPIYMLVSLIKKLVGYEGKTRWVTEKGNGQIKKLLDNTRMREKLEWEPETNLEDGLKETIEWYQNTIKSA